MRELRNHTSTVLKSVEEGDTVFLTNRGVRVAELKPVERRRPIEVLIDKAAAISRGDSGAFDELIADKEADVDPQRRQDAGSPLAEWLADHAPGQSVRVRRRRVR